MGLSYSQIKADPFWGNGEMRLPKPEGIAAAWAYLKAQTGNTHPGATLPFGMVSACAYSGAYPTGYSVNGVSCHGFVPKQFARKCANGFTHFQHSGTGGIGIYYNYFRVTPLPDARLEQRNVRHPLVDETAEPGYYATSLEGAGIRAELSAGAKAIAHRYSFQEGLRPSIAIETTSGGLDVDGFAAKSVAQDLEMRLLEDGAVEACVMMEGARIFMHAKADMPSAKVSIFDGARRLDCRSLKLSGAEIGPDSQFGFVIDAPSGMRTVEMKIGFSLKSFAKARTNCEELASFDETRRAAAAKWADCLGLIEIDADERTMEVFKSVLYHSFVKPSDCHGESPFGGDGDFYLDFSTIWDIYKTQLPMLAMLFPERMAGIVNTFLDSAERTGKLPHCLLMADFNASEGKRHDMQARALACHSILDAFHYGVRGVDWRRALDVMAKDVFGAHNDDFVKGGVALPFTHTLDLAAASDCVRQLAEALGDSRLASLAASNAGKWLNAYDRETGLLKEGEYYEGTLWNYSFRLLHDMQGRIDFCGRERFVELLDKFFGYGAEPVSQLKTHDEEDRLKAYDLHRFEGFNNEPDMEVPYAYIYAGRHDRTAEVVRSGMRYMFAPGDGGAPGNVDSGGLSAWYVWSALGLFPVAGQDLFLIGSPAVRSARIRLPQGRALSIVCHGNSEECIYVKSATWNGKALDKACIPVAELLKGGELVFEMSSAPGMPFGAPVV